MAITKAGNIPTSVPVIKKLNKGMYHLEGDIPVVDLLGTSVVDASAVVVVAAAVVLEVYTPDVTM